ncbi:prepilin-type cleavage/methylation domain-containing protein [Saccharobesus litoralis]|uniref:Prepilin-type cleavage/methylation domain-containing protein n=1 Tax=Saccharobesus litoralis TaxID=2172099 RepID=A0A2S0VXB4_9ALTE|nr:type II secretion system protein [Saccharobesus litoralis]AWB68812.1 prepilin-type cleavage/methylation domain-containing protein [Saccharobesus litoralis]
MKKQQGFTLIELVIVIVILGILAVTAAPKFLDIQGDAQASTVQAVAGSMKTASDMIRAKALIEGVQNTASTDIDLDNGQDVDVAFGYPEHDWADSWDELIDASVSELTNGNACTNEFCVDESEDISGDTNDNGVALSGLGTNNANTIALIIYPSGTTNTSDCYAYYIYDQTVTGNEPFIGSVTSGC